MPSARAIAILLTSAAPLLMAGGSAFADGSIYSGNYTSLVIDSDSDFVILDNTFHATDDVINAAIIAPGDGNHVAFTLESPAKIDGSLINAALAAISATDMGSSPAATAIALRLEGTVPDVANDGSISALANAVSAGSEVAGTAVGIAQNASGSPEAGLFNSGDILVEVVANALEDVTSAQAQAVAYRVESSSALNLAVFNSGLIDIVASASADTSNVIAVGIFATPKVSTGSIVNSGSVLASAVAEGTSGVASAGGILNPSTFSTVNIINTGLISVYAEGPTAIASGIMIIPPFTAEAAPEPITEAAAFNPQAPYATIANNGGTIWSGGSTDGGATIERGTAISSENAPNQALIQLTGINGGNAKDGQIFGNIVISADDAIEVANGKTSLDGFINPDEARKGSLAISADGNLLLLNREQGASAAFVDVFTVAPDGAFGLELNASSSPADVPVVSADEAFLSGRLNVVYQADLYEDFTSYDNVIRADSRDGAFGFVTDNSVLLNTEQVEDGNTIDIEVTRIAFGGVAGLTRNQQAAGNAIESVYSEVKPQTDFGNLVAHLFTFGGEEYPIQLNSLAGAEFAQYLQSVIWSTSQLNRAITERMECDGPWQHDVASMVIGGQAVQPAADLTDNPAGCFQSGRVSLWGHVSGSWNRQDGDAEAPGYDEDQYAFIAGADWSLNESFYLGVAAGYLDSHMDFEWFGNSIDYDGAQLAVYGGHDDTTNYARGIVSYGTYDGDSNRLVSIEPAQSSDYSSDPDSDVVSFYGEMGHRFVVGANSQVTPFAGLVLARGEIDSFTESDQQGSGAALSVHESDGNSAASVLGLRLGGDWALGGGNFRPDFSVAWMHEFDDTRQSVAASFTDAPGDAKFTAVSAKSARDSAIIEAGGTFALSDSVELGITYDGRYSADYSATAVTGRVGVKF